MNKEKLLPFEAKELRKDITVLHEIGLPPKKC